MNTLISDAELAAHAVVSRERWITERKALLEREKAFTRERDALARARRALPWVRVEKSYVFDTVDGPRTLAELFGDHRQLIVQHFMFAPGWEEGCRSCSYMADNTDGMTAHLANRGVSFVAVSRAPLDELQNFRRRMGWKFAWVSSNASDFNADFGVSFPDNPEDGEVDYNYVRQSYSEEEAPGISVFYRDDGGTVFHTYSTTAAASR
jgi:predicted dithiol-disulfide oxidoreductase (DUF899 family)